MLRQGSNDSAQEHKDLFSGQEHLDPEKANETSADSLLDSGPSQRRSLSLPARTHNAAALAEVRSAVADTRRYLTESTSRDFLTSSNSRRDMWRLLLPLPGLFAMLGDQWHTHRLILDAVLATFLFLMGGLPTRWIMSDVAICFIYAVYLPLHSVIGSFPSTLSAASPVIATFTMASTGINSWTLASFVLLSILLAPYIAYAWTHDQIVVCVYIVIVAILVERRSTLLISCDGKDSEITREGYEALGLTDSAFFQFSRAHRPTSAEDPETAKLLSLQPDLEFGDPDTEPFTPLQPTVLKNRTNSLQDFYFSMKGSSPRSSPRSKLTSSTSLRGVKLGGFSSDQLNVLFVEKPASAWFVNGRETYWSLSNKLFIYKSAKIERWGVAKAKSFQAIQEGASSGIAYSPDQFEIWLDDGESQPSSHGKKQDWREWDADADSWSYRPGSGVHSRGKLRPKTASSNNAEAAVQASVDMQERAVQTAMDKHIAPVTGSSNKVELSSTSTSDAYASGSICFGKFDDYPFWPCYIRSIQSKEACFFGDSSIGVVQSVKPFVASFEKHRNRDNSPEFVFALTESIAVFLKVTGQTPAEFAIDSGTPTAVIEEFVQAADGSAKVAEISGILQGSDAYTKIATSAVSVVSKGSEGHADALISEETGKQVMAPVRRPQHADDRKSAVPASALMTSSAAGTLGLLGKGASTSAASGQRETEASVAAPETPEQKEKISKQPEAPASRRRSPDDRKSAVPDSVAMTSSAAATLGALQLKSKRQQ